MRFEPLRLVEATLAFHFRYMHTFRIKDIGALPFRTGFL